MYEVVRSSKQVCWFSSLTLLLLAGCAAEEPERPPFDVTAFAQSTDGSGGAAPYSGAFCTYLENDRPKLRLCEDREDVEYFAFYENRAEYVDVIRAFIRDNSFIHLNLDYAIPFDDYAILDRVKEDVLLFAPDEIYPTGEGAVFGVTDARYFCELVLEANDDGEVFRELPVTVRSADFLWYDGSELDRHSIDVVTDDDRRYEVTCVDRPPLSDLI